MTSEEPMVDTSSFARQLFSEKQEHITGEKTACSKIADHVHHGTKEWKIVGTQVMERKSRSLVGIGGVGQYIKLNHEVKTTKLSVGIESTAFCHCHSLNCF